MKIKPTNNINFKGALNNKLLLKSLETVANHSATFAASTSLLMSLTLRPLAIKKTPKVENKNKQYSIANSISSGLTKFLAVELFAYPIEKTILSIEKNPDLFLNKKSNDFFKNSPESFGFLSQVLKQGTNFISAIPKSIVCASLIPVLMDKLFSNKENAKQNSLSFKGNASGFLSKTVSGYFNNEKIQNYAKNNLSKSKDITRNIMIASDTILTGFSALCIHKNKKIDSKSKNNLIINNILSSAFSITAGASLDKIIQTSSKNLIENFKKANANNPKLDKYIQGINVLRPVVIFSLVYYGLLPIFSNFLAQRISDNVNRRFFEKNK